MLPEVVSYRGSVVFVFPWMLFGHGLSCTSGVTCSQAWGSSLLSPGFDIRLWFVYLLIDEEHFALMFSFLVPLAFGECVGQVRVRGWSTSFPPQLQLLFLGEDGAAPFLTQQGEPISPSAALAGL